MNASGGERKRELRKKCPAWGLSLGCLALMSLYPCLFQYSTNLPEARFQDALIFWGIFLAAGLLAFLVCLAILRRVEAAGFLSGLCLLVWMNFGLLKNGLRHFFPWMPGILVLGVCAVVLLAIGAGILMKKWRCHVPLVLLTVMFAALCVVSGALAVPKLISGGGGDTSAPVTAAESTGKDLPNVYYFLYDEYSGPEGLEYFYGFDNSGFYDALTQRGFSCSSDSYNTESCATVQLVPDLYGLDYDVPPFESGDGNTPVLYQVFEKLGYGINVISHNDFLDTDGANNLTKGQAADSIGLYLYQNSLLPDTPLGTWMEGSMPQLRANYQYQTLLDETLDTMENAWQYTGTGPTVTFGYVQCPHTWFIYDAEGKTVPYSEHLNWRDPQYYLGQLQYVNQCILTAVDGILTHDPTAVIILQSDHGARVGYHLAELYGDDYDPETETIHQQNILNCVYAGGRQLDISGLSGINTLRTVLNQVYGMEYDRIPQREGFINYYP